MRTHIQVSVSVSDVSSHSETYEYNGFDADEHGLKLPYKEIILEPNQVVFVPREQVVSYKTLVKADVTFMMRNCFVDASNIRHFVSASSLETETTSQINTRLLHAFSTVDHELLSTLLYMNQLPKDLSLTEYFSQTNSTTTTTTTRTTHNFAGMYGV
jgi:hypothetical protein